MTSLEDFKRRAAAATLVPVWKDCLLDTDTPVSAFAKLRRAPFAFLLESAPAGGETWSRYTYLGTEPRCAWRLSSGVVDDWNSQRGWHNARTPTDPLADLGALIDAATPAEVPELGQFWGGVVGYFSYDIVRLIEKLPNRPADGLGIPDAIFVFTRSLVILDNLHGQARVVISVPIPKGARDAELASLHEKASAELDELLERLRKPARLEPMSPDLSATPIEGDSSYERAAFMTHVERIKEYIRAGDCFQALLSRRIDVPLDFEPSDLYRALRAINPSPYMYHLALDGVEIIGSSPELLVRVSEGRITLRPIAGTRPRGKSGEEDERLSADLLADEKERAEHVMLVDLGRNDVGRVARYGTVKVTELMKVEKYSHVLHIVSQVEGELNEGLSALDVFRATFPAGTMTGAPKIRAMEIIDELEPVSRGPYAGCVGYIAAGGKRMDLAITIRTCVIADGKASVQAGAGIVADSVPEREWEETRSKAQALLSAIASVRRPIRNKVQ
ncbi:MAG TPA: anthranilate synthase component I [Gemmatimonadaceae bacterium]|nr:anthranilate synthase component I [Gemmatimonadaceae bacterium]